MGGLVHPCPGPKPLSNSHFVRPEPSVHYRFSHPPHANRVHSVLVCAPLIDTSVCSVLMALRRCAALQLSTSIATGKLRVSLVFPSTVHRPSTGWKRVSLPTPNTSVMLQVSSVLRGFLDSMLMREPSQRATAQELLRHPFLKLAGPPSCIVPLMRQHRHR